MQQERYTFAKVIITLQNKIQTIFAKKSKSLNLKRTEIDILLSIFISNEAKATPHDLISLLEIDKSQLSRNVKQLTQKNLVYRQNVADNQKSIQLILTETGKKIAIEIIDAISNQLNESLSHFSKNDKDSISNWLSLLIQK